MVDTLRIGFIGTGTMGQRAHLRNFSKLPDCTVVALAELRPELGAEVARRYGVGQSYTDHTAMLGENQLDGLVVPQRFDLHGQLVPPLLEHGLPILTEKPLAGSPEVGRAILTAAEQQPGNLFIGYHKRSDPAVACARARLDEWLASGAFGGLRFIRMSMPPGDWIANGFDGLVQSDEPFPTLMPDPATEAVPESERPAYTQFVNYYIHQVNLMRHLYGEDYRVMHVDRHQRILVTESDSGVPGILEMHTHQTSRDWQEEILIALDQATIRIQLPAPLVLNQSGRVTVFTDDGKEPVFQQPVLPQRHAFWCQAEHFLRAIRGEAHPLCGPAEALKDLETAVDVINAARAARG